MSEEVVTQSCFMVAILVLQAEVALVRTIRRLGFLSRRSQASVVTQNQIIVLIGHLSWDTDFGQWCLAGLLGGSPSSLGPALIPKAKVFVAVTGVS